MARERFGVVPMEDRECVDPRTAAEHLLGEVRTELQLAHTGGVALGDNRGVRRHVLEHRRHQPQMVSVDHFRFEIVDHWLQVIDPCPAVGPELVVGQGRKTAARIRHDVAHTGQREVERWSAENERVDVAAAHTADLGMRVVGWYADHHALLMTGCGGMTNDGVEGNAAAGERGPLRQGVEDAHGPIIGQESGIWDSGFHRRSNPGVRIRDIE